MNRTPFGRALGARTSGKIPYKDFDTGDGYVYRQYQDTDRAILILKSPKGGAGTLVSKDTHPDAWAAITAQIKGIREGRTASTLTTIFSTITTTAAALQPQRKRRRRKASDAAYVAPSVPDAPPAPPWGLLAAGAAVVVVGGIILTRK